jgi:ComF family protein
MAERSRISSLLGEAAEGFGQLLWPVECINCGRYSVASGSSLCDECWSGLSSVCSADYCHRCGRDVSPYAVFGDSCPLCHGDEVHFDRIARAGIYADTLRKMVLAFKNGKTELDSVMTWLADSTLQTSAFFGDIDFFVPVPLHWFKRFTRGYNQSHLLTRKLKHPAAQISTDLVRIRFTKRQPDMLTLAARAKNVAGAFAVRYRHPFKNRRICLVDDVKTTGATLNECAKTLKEAGATKVFALVIAVAGQNNS